MDFPESKAGIVTNANYAIDIFVILRAKRKQSREVLPDRVLDYARTIKLADLNFVIRITIYLITSPNPVSSCFSRLSSTPAQGTIFSPESRV